MADSATEDSKDETTKLQFINAKNSGFVLPEDKDELGIKELVVWGGFVGNCAEHSLSQTVDGQRNSLTSVTYCPSWTKGGVLIRPKYWLGNRSATAVFPSLTDLVIRLDPLILPQDYGWVTPALRRLRLLHIMQSAGQDDETEFDMGPQMPSQEALSRLSPEDSAQYLQRILEASPELESVTIALASTAAPSQEWLDWLYIAPPRPVPWGIQRLLFIAVQKPHGECSLSVLPPNLVASILRFLGSMTWKRHVIKPSAMQLAEVGLAQDLEQWAPEQ